MTAAVSFTVEGATVQINLPPGTTIADVDKRRLAKLVDAVQPPTESRGSYRLPVENRLSTLSRKLSGLAEVKV